VQQSISPCETNGLCTDPLGPSTIGLIYVNPEGPINATGDPKESARDIRNIFANMGFDDRSTVALVGGGHAFGKSHGACPKGPGPDPIQAPSDPWPGLCEVCSPVP
jgi:catalase-peroxidase